MEFNLLYILLAFIFSFLGANAQKVKMQTYCTGQTIAPQDMEFYISGGFYNESAKGFTDGIQSLLEKKSKK